MTADTPVAGTDAKPLSKWLVTTVDLTGTFVLAVHGASVAAASGLDLLGILAVALISAMGGGILRDILLGETPPEGHATGKYDGLHYTAASKKTITHPSGSDN